MNLFQHLYKYSLLYLFFIISSFDLIFSKESLQILGKIDINPSTLVDTRIIIQDTNTIVHPNYKGFFRVNLTKGNYFLRILNPEFVFDTIEIQIFEEETNDGIKLSCKKFIFDIESNSSIKKINEEFLIIKPLYSTKPEKNSQDGLFSILSLLKNPLVLISVISLGITFILPMLQDSLDAEAIEEITGSIPGSDYISKFLSKIS